MKGIIFKEFLNMVEEKYGYELVDKLILSSNLTNNGSYTSVGTYPHSEMVSLVTQLSTLTQIPVAKLLEEYGKYAFKIFAEAYKNMFEGHTNTFSFLSSIENHIHVEVLKLYPEAELPAIPVTEIDKNKMVMTYKSTRKMADFAKGLIKGSLLHFNEKATIELYPIKKDHSEVKIVITRK